MKSASYSSLTMKLVVKSPSSPILVHLSNLHLLTRRICLKRHDEHATFTHARLGRLSLYANSAKPLISWMSLSTGLGVPQIQVRLGQRRRPLWNFAAKHREATGLNASLGPSPIGPTRP